MKKFPLFFTLCFWLSASKAQEYVFDPQYCASVVANGAVRSSAEETHNQYLGKINTNLDDININVGSVVTAQTIIYKGLSNVNSALKDGLEVKNMAVMINDMISNLDQCLELAKSQPYLLLFATGIEHEMQLRAISLVSDVSGYVLKEGSNVLADYNSRDQLLRKVTQELQILDSLAYGAWRAMYWAKERGIIASINPYASYINKDKAFVSQIIGNAKYLHQTF
jgi:molybdenum cofactor biosynthesis enzyme MoaA